eukprot:CAMPEP_0116017596 /NCGR_PEP_ID=MMETSP0321-20121206/8139_1 /TAXON_ID=163516 /ORGANISM="Leptocylindrus danicus var. danicus, Strain B650" /LENGTH=647 /DNA_ID=CAMNT_0003487813 /DNA_START=53 /DNA_END=1996 /DNA_ORIENTATION=-
MDGLVPDNQFTAVIYNLIKEEKYDECVRILEIQIQNLPRSRAALSLLGFCYYNLEDYLRASSTYEILVGLCPENTDYQIYQAQSLLKAGSHQEAAKVSAKINPDNHTHKVALLQANISFEQEDFGSSRAYLDRCLPDDPETIVAEAAILFRGGYFVAAREKFLEALDIVGYQADLSYGLALCHFKLNANDEAINAVNDIIENEVRNHPELCVGSKEPGNLSVGNSATLQTTYLIEAFNLKAAIEHQSERLEEAKMALNDMPPRNENELDAVTLHNQAILNINEDPTSGFRKLNHLLSNPPFAAETFGNLLLLYCQHGYYDTAADILAENAHLTFHLLSQELYDFLDAAIMTSTSADEAYRKYEALASKSIERLRKLTKTLSDANVNKDKESVKLTLREFDDELERYIPTLMAMGGYYWDKEDYDGTLQLFRQSAEFCCDHDTWKLNIAHVFFMLEKSKYKEAISYYVPFVKNHNRGDILGIPAIVLANLCVSYIMTNRNEEAEDIMKEVEKAEEQIFTADKSKRLYHSCIINLCIGTLYCEKGNFEFGINRVCKSLTPYEKKLSPDTWFYAKRCFLALANHLSKQLILLKDSTMHSIIAFLDDIIDFGRNISTAIMDTMDSDESDNNTNSDVSHEARQLKLVFVKLC